MAILLSYILLFFNIKDKFNYHLGFKRITDSCLLAGKQISLIASIILCASIIGVLSMTGLGIKLTSLIISFLTIILVLALLFAIFYV